MEDTPAWMVCDAILAKARDELLSQAISLMHEQMEKKRLALEGQVMKTSEEMGEREKDMFLLSQIVKEHANIEKRFSSYLSEAQMKRDSLPRVEELQRFLLELRQIVLLYDYSKACEAWVMDVEKELKERSPERILARTMQSGLRARREILGHLLKSKLMLKDGVFSQADREIMGGAFSMTKE